MEEEVQKNPPGSKSEENPERGGLFLPLTRLKPPQGHHREVWCLAISPNGDHLASASHDKSMRLWERTREPVILEEEREMVRAAGASARRSAHRPHPLLAPSSLLTGARGGV